MKQEFILEVPDYVMHISDWKELELPKGHYIMDKVVTGCGFTEYFLNNEIPVILCSPRKVLLSNKHQQHPTTTYLFKNEIDKDFMVDLNLNEKYSEEVIKVNNEKEYILGLRRNLANYISTTQTPPKILVTYDSLRHILETIYEIDPNLINSFQVVVDEFQSIFMDSRFKASTELEFVTNLQNVPNVCYLSATPMMKEYLEQLDEFKDLPYYQLKWPDNMVTDATIYEKNVRSIIQPCLDIIKNYKNGNYPKKEYNGQIIESKEVVFYVNSVKDICSIIKKSGLKEDEVNVICAHDSKNLKKLKLAGIKNYGIVPLKGDPHKMFTFCTRTVYLGADFYSPSAYTVICSDCNIESMSLDISLDLPQIMGRQRLEENIFRDEAIIFYKTTGKTSSKEDRDEYEKRKLNETNTCLSLFMKIKSPEERKSYIKDKNTLIRVDKYTENYISISKDKNGETILVLNKLVLLSERRAWEIKNGIYKNKASVIKGISENFNISEYNGDKILIEQFISEFEIDKNFERRMKLYCDFLNIYPNYSEILKTNSKIPRDYSLYYSIIGPEKIKSVSYIESNIRNIIDQVLKKDELSGVILHTFFIGNKYTKKYIKEKLQEIYNQLNIKKVAKITILDEYFEVKRARISTNIAGKYDEGLEIIQLK